MRRALNGMRAEEAVDNILNMFSRTRNNAELIQLVKKTKLIQTRYDIYDTMTKLFRKRNLIAHRACD